MRRVTLKCNSQASQINVVLTLELGAHLGVRLTGDLGGSGEKLAAMRRRIVGDGVAKARRGPLGAFGVLRVKSAPVCSERIVFNCAQQKMMCSETARRIEQVQTIT